MASSSSIDGGKRMTWSFLTVGAPKPWVSPHTDKPFWMIWGCPKFDKPPIWKCPRNQVQWQIIKFLTNNCRFWGIRNLCTAQDANTSQQCQCLLRLPFLDMAFTWRFFSYTIFLSATTVLAVNGGWDDRATAVIEVLGASQIALVETC